MKPNKVSAQTNIKPMSLKEKQKKCEKLNVEEKQKKGQFKPSINWK